MTWLEPGGSHAIARAGRLARHGTIAAAKNERRKWPNRHITHPIKLCGTGPTFGICVLKVSKSYSHVLRLFLPTVFSDAVIGPIAKSFFDSLIIGPIP